MKASGTPRTVFSNRVEIHGPSIVSLPFWRSTRPALGEFAELLGNPVRTRKDSSGVANGGPPELLADGVDGPVYSPSAGFDLGPWSVALRRPPAGDYRGAARAAMNVPDADWRPTRPKG